MAKEKNNTAVRAGEIPPAAALDEAPAPAAPIDSEQPAAIEAAAPAASPPEYTGPLVVLSYRGSGGLEGYSQAEYREGDLVGRPTDKERKLLDGVSLPLEQWWPGLPKDHRPVLGRSYPVLLLRPGTRELWVRENPKTLRRLAAIDRRSALLAIHRCSERDELLPIVAGVDIPEYRAAAQAALAGRPEETTPVALSSEGGMPVVLAAGGAKSNAVAVYLADLLPLIEKCEDRRALRALETQDPRADAKQAAQARLKQLAQAHTPEAREGAA